MAQNHMPSCRAGSCLSLWKNKFTKPVRAIPLTTISRAKKVHFLVEVYEGNFSISMPTFSRVFETKFRKSFKLVQGGVLPFVPEYSHYFN